MLRRLGFPDAAELPDPVPLTLQLLAEWPVAYGTFFQALADRIAAAGVPPDPEALPPFVVGAVDPPQRERWLAWRQGWWAASQELPSDRQAKIPARLRRWNLPCTPVRSEIERIWEAIDQHDDWQPFHAWLAGCGSGDATGAGCWVLQPLLLSSV